MIEEHFQYLSDRRRLDAYRAAIESVVRPGSVVLDLGAGTGVLGLMACRAGAARVYAVDSGPILALARESAAASGFADRVRSVRGHSTEVDLPEKVDLVVADQMGPIGIEAGLLRSFADARVRHLRPGGVLLPRALEVFAAPVEDAAAHAKIRFWHGMPGGFDFSPFGRAAASTTNAAAIRPEQLLGGPVRLLDLDLAVADPLRVAAEVVLPVARAGTIHGIAAWFRATLAPGISLTNAPGDAGRIDRQAAFLPFGGAVAVAPGDEVALRFHMLPEGGFLAWRAGVRRGAGGALLAELSRSTLDAQPLSPGDLGRRRPDFRPRLGRRGEAARTVLALCDGDHALSAIRSAVAEQYPETFRTPAEVEAFVSRVIEEATPHPESSGRGGAA